MRRLNSIRYRLTVATVASVWLFGLLLGLAARSWIERDLRASLRTFARHEAHEFTSALGDAKSPAEVLAKRDLLDRLFPEEGVVSLDVWSMDEEMVVAYPSSGAALRAWPSGLREALAGREPWEELTLPGHPSALRTAAPISIEGQARWVVVASVRTDRVAKSLRRFTRSYLIGLVVFVVLSAGGAYLLVGRALQPVRSLVTTAERLVTESDPHGRLDLPQEGSELAELVTLINGLLARAEETVARLRRFTAHAGHELRTPLSRMRGEVELALRSGSKAQGVAALHGVLEEIDAQRNVIDALLQLAHSGEPIDLSQQDPLDLSALAEEIGEEAQHLPESEGRTIVLDVQPGLSVLGLRPLIARALWNLLHNAMAYSVPEGRVNLSVSREGKLVVAQVQNTPAAGLPPLSEDLFEPFARAEAASGIRSEGHGLGLALTRAIALRHGGKLVGGNHPDGRVWVRLELPAN